jgi:hypothetical protein
MIGLRFVFPAKMLGIAVELLSAFDYLTPLSGSLGAVALNN